MVRETELYASELKADAEQETLIHMPVSFRGMESTVSDLGVGFSFLMGFIRKPSKRLGH